MVSGWNRICINKKKSRIGQCSWEPTRNYCFEDKEIGLEKVKCLKRCNIQ